MKPSHKAKKQQKSYIFQCSAEIDFYMMFKSVPRVSSISLYSCTDRHGGIEHVFIGHRCVPQTRACKPSSKGTVVIITTIKKNAKIIDLIITCTF